MTESSHEGQRLRSIPILADAGSGSSRLGAKEQTATAIHRAALNAPGECGEGNYFSYFDPDSDAATLILTVVETREETAL